jgi:hypothetical protein
VRDALYRSVHAIDSVLDVSGRILDRMLDAIQDPYARAVPLVRTLKRTLIIPLKLTLGGAMIIGYAPGAIVSASIARRCAARKAETKR